MGCVLISGVLVSIHSNHKTVFRITSSLKKSILKLSDVLGMSVGGEVTRTAVSTAEPMANALFPSVRARKFSNPESSCLSLENRKSGYSTVY